MIIEYKFTDVESAGSIELVSLLTVLQDFQALGVLDTELLRLEK